MSKAAYRMALRFLCEQDLYCIKVSYIYVPQIVEVLYNIEPRRDILSSERCPLYFLRGLNYRQLLFCNIGSSCTSWKFSRIEGSNA